MNSDWGNPLPDEEDDLSVPAPEQRKSSRSLFKRRGDAVTEVDWKWMYEEEATKFRRETLRTAELTSALREARAVCNFVALSMETVPDGIPDVGGWPLYRFARRVRGQVDDLLRRSENVA